MTGLHISPAALRIVHHLVGMPPQTIADLMKATGVTRTAIMEQLGELAALGLVERTTERLSGRGRPRHRYGLTQRALQLLFQGNQHLLVPALLRAVEEIGGDALRRKVIKRVARILADNYWRSITGTDPQERLAQFCQLLTANGEIAEVVAADNGHTVLRKRSCAFISMFEDSRAVCAIDRELLSLVTGVSVRQITSRHDGGFCCEFCLDSSEA